MKTSTKLILLLTVMVGVVMAIGGYFILRQREVVLEKAMHNEVRAHAHTLQIALEGLYQADRTEEAQQLINSLSRNPRVYGVLLFDADGKVEMVSDPLVADEIRYPDEVRQVVATGVTVETIRRIRKQEVSTIMPIRVGTERRGAFEIAQPMSFIRADVALARRQIGVITLLLFAVITLAVVVVFSYSLIRPIRELLRGAAALGRGDLDYRVVVPGKGNDFARLASEFNRMADNLEDQRIAATREAERRLALERELRHSERLASVGRLAAGVAHEIGTPLNVIDMRTEQLMGDPDVPAERYLRNLKTIRSQVAKIARIVRQLLDLARPYKLNREAVDLVALLSGTLELLEADLKSARIRPELLHDGRVMVDGDRDFLQQVFTNIVMNAVQVMPDGGRLRIECLGNLAEKDGRSFATVWISDNGGGISPGDLPHIFDPFYTTKDVGSGTGLGLTVSYRIAEEHGGWIEATNNME